MINSSSTSFLLLALMIPSLGHAVQLPEEKPLWPEGTPAGGAIQYDVAEKVIEHSPGKTAPSRLNRVFSFVSKPTYSIHRPAERSGNGIGLVICPGGGFRDVWLDREGHDLALWLKDRGVTSLVLKYRTNAELEAGKRKYPSEVYVPAVTADARQAIRILREQAAELRLDTHRIGICGFSAGGALALYTILQPDPESGSKPVSDVPDFAGLIYPGLRDADGQLLQSIKKIPPLFIINAIDDHMTPVDRCLDFYQLLLKAGASAELHLFSQGGHGFDMGEGHGESVAMWKESFVAWLKDRGFAAGSEPR